MLFSTSFFKFRTDQIVQFNLISQSHKQKDELFIVLKFEIEFPALNSGWALVSVLIRTVLKIWNFQLLLSLNIVCDWNLLMFSQQQTIKIEKISLPITLTLLHLLPKINFNKTNW